VSRRGLGALWDWIKRPDLPRRAGGPARPIPVTDTEVSVLAAAEYPELPDVGPGPGVAEVRTQIDALGPGIDAATATALDEILLSRERGWLARLDAERSAHQSWVDGAIAQGRSLERRLDAELADVESELARLDEVLDEARLRLRRPEPYRPGRRRR
jgi:hypothetical protein